jgi:urease accessory protein
MSNSLPEASPRLPSLAHPSAATPGTARLAFQRPDGHENTGLSGAFATSPLRILTPRNHGSASWVFLASLGGGLLDGDRLDVKVDVAPGASALLGTQSSTKVYRSRPGAPGASQNLRADVGAGALLVAIPDPVVCFADARYEQNVDVSLAPSSSLCLLDGYTCGRSARGERWAFSRYASRTTVRRAGAVALVDAVRLDPRHGPLAARMGRFDVVLTLVALGPRCAAICDAMLDAAVRASSASTATPEALVAASPLVGVGAGDGGCILRVAAPRFEMASHVLHSSFTELARVLGDDPFARKW